MECHLSNSISLLGGNPPLGTAPRPTGSVRWEKLPSVCPGCSFSVYWPNITSTSISFLFLFLTLLPFSGLHPAYNGPEEQYYIKTKQEKWTKLHESWQWKGQEEKWEKIGWRNGKYFREWLPCWPAEAGWGHKQKAQQITAGRGGLGESGQGLGAQGKQGMNVWDGEQKATRADGEGVKIDQRAGSSVIATWHSSQTRIKHYLCSFAFLGCQGENGNPPAAQLCLAALVPRICCYGWALLEHSCMKGARVGLSVLLVLNCTCICSML